MIHKHKNNSQNNWALVNKLFPIAYEKWNGKIQKVGRWVSHELNERQMERRKNTVKFCSNDTEESHSCIVSLLRIFFWESQAQKIMDRPRRTIQIDRKTESLWQEDSVFGGTRRVWSIMSYWSLAKRLIPNAINNNWSIWTVHCLKNDQNTKRSNTSHFSPWQCSITYDKISLGHVGSTQLGSSTPCGLLIRFGSFRLPLVCIVTYLLSSALVRTRRCEKMAQ